MPRNQSTGVWKPVDLPGFERLAGSDQSYSLPRDQWPRWAANSTKFTRLVVYCPAATNPIASMLTTAPIIGRILTERLDPKDAPEIYNHNLYLLAQTSEGKVYQSPPLVPSEPKHRSSAPSTWFDSYGPPPT
jgi:hypothetical protein